jgi:hypothetical protein
MSARAKLIATAVAVGLSVVAASGRPAAVEATPLKASCGPFGASTSKTTEWFKAGTFEQTVSNAQSIPIYIPKLCCYKYLGCFLC